MPSYFNQSQIFGAKFKRPSFLAKCTIAAPKTNHRGLSRIKYTQTLSPPAGQTRRALRRSVRGHLQVDASVLPLAALVAAARFSVRVIPGRAVLGALARPLLIQRLTPLVVGVLALYGSAITLYALWQNKRHCRELQQQTYLQRSSGTASMITADGGVGSAHNQKPQAAVEQRCKVCGGRGVITWEGKVTYYDQVCPACLVSKVGRVYVCAWMLD
jgi:hypothetical protein